MKSASAFVLAGALMGAGVQGLALGGAMVVYTPSVPVGLYWRHDVRPETLVRDAYVCVQATSSHAPTELRERVLDGRLPAAWRKDALVKRVAAVEGQRVDYANGRGVLVDGELLPQSVALPRDSQGHALPFPSYPVVLERGQVWLRAEHPQGLDSRYLGAVEVRAITCVAEPVWTW